jgi:hypothetical protein
MTNYWPATWNSALTEAFTGPNGRISVQIVFIGPDGKQDGEPLVLVAPAQASSPSPSPNNGHAPETMREETCLDH